MTGGLQSQVNVINVRIAGLGGQGIILASDILADAAVRAGLDVKKSELHGMSQRGGSVSSDVRFGAKVWSPMISEGEVDFLVVTSPDQVENNLPALKAGGILIRSDQIDEQSLLNKKSLNVALMPISTRMSGISTPVKSGHSALAFSSGASRSARRSVMSASAAA
jgi:indolepyruvate ferredoxin oxidoreductase, beta subunit